jgi:hypothetical protein
MIGTDAFQETLIVKEIRFMGVLSSGERGGFGECMRREGYIWKWGVVRGSGTSTTFFFFLADVLIAYWWA